jgi:type IV fimbrial biogenesis protein FimT
MREQQGFTIIELMSVILIGSILIMIAIPNYTVFVKNNCLTTNANKLVASFSYARSEAIKRRDIVHVRTGGDWGTGWDVIWEADDGTETTLRTEALTCGSTSVVEAGADTDFEYSQTGFIDAAGSFDICDDRTGETGRQITISATGRPHTNAALVCP